MQKWLCILGLLYAFHANAQLAGSRVPDRYTIVFIEPVAALDYNNGPSIRAGAEHRFSPDWSVSATGGAYFQKGFIVRTELKLLIPDDNEVHFISLEYEYLSHAYTFEDGYIKSDSTGRESEDPNRPMNYTMDKHIHQINLKFGNDKFWRHHWWLEMYAGLGIKFKNASRDIPYADLDQLYHYHQSATRHFSSKDGNFVTFALSCGIKFGRVFPRRS